MLAALSVLGGPLLVAAFEFAYTYATTGSFQAGLFAAFSSIAMANLPGGDNGGWDAFIAHPQEFLIANTARALAAGALQGTLSVLRGGSFGSAFRSAAIGSFTSSFAPTGRGVTATIERAIIGGTSSAITGGKFVNGAATAIFQAMADNAQEKYQEQDSPRNQSGYPTVFDGEPFYIPDFGAPIVQVAFTGPDTPELNAQIFSAAANFYESQGISVQFEEVPVGTKNSLLVNIYSGTPLLNPDSSRSVTNLSSWFGNTVKNIQLNADAQSPEYVFSHELGHAFGLNDRYDQKTFIPNIGYSGNLMGEYYGNSLYFRQIQTINGNLNNVWRPRIKVE